MSPSSLRRTRALLSASLLAASVLALGSPVAMAAVPMTHIHANTSSCITGSDTIIEDSDLGVEVQLWSSGGQLLDTADSGVVDGDWDVCVDRDLQAGMRVDVRTFQGGMLIGRLTLPAIGVQVDRASDVVKGTGPRNQQLQIRLSRCTIVAPTGCPLVATRTVTADGQGKFSKDVTSAMNLRGLDLVAVRSTDPSGDQFTRRIDVPVMFLTVGSPFVQARSRPGVEARFRLLDHPGGSSISTRDVPFNGEGESEFEFSKVVSAGRQVRSDIASDALVTIPTVSVQMVESGSDQVIKARCLPDRKMVVEYASAVRVLTADHNGRANFVSDVAIAPDPFLVVRCQTPGGDTLLARTGV